MDVQLYCYDLSRGMAKGMSKQFLGVQIDAIWHTAIVINNLEIFFGQGVQQSTPPGATHHGRPIEIINLGQTQLPFSVIMDYLESLKVVYTAESYDLFAKNCNNFSNDFAQFLVGRGIPDHITNLPETVLNTPFGQMLKPQIDASMRSITQASVPAQNIPPQSALSPSTNGKVQAPPVKKGPEEHGEVYHVVDIPRLDALLAEARDGCATIFFTSSTCAPCRLAYPTFDSLAAQNPQAIFIKTDLNQADEIGQRYQVRATPTFHTYLRGKRLDEWSGADPGRLRTTVEMLVKQAFPGHPHGDLNVPTLAFGSLRPITFTKIPPLDKVISKMGPAATDPAVQSMRDFILARSSPGAKPSDVALPDLGPWAKFLRSAPTKLPPDALFAAYDLLRCALLDSRAAAWFAAEAAQGGAAREPTPVTIKSLISHVAALNASGTCPYNLRLVTLQLSCVLLAGASPLMPAAVLHATSGFTPELAQLSASSLLAEPDKPACRVAAASLAFNLAAANYRVRREDGTDKEVLAQESQVELVAALLECLGEAGAGRKEGAHQALMTLGYLVYFADPQGEVLDLCAAMGARAVVAAVECEGKVRECKGDVVRVLPE